LKVQQANVDAQRARVTAEAGPVLYLAKPFGSNDTEAVAQLIARSAGGVVDVGGCVALKRMA
jgi:hypothetical protein